MYMREIVTDKTKKYNVDIGQCSIHNISHFEINSTSFCTLFLCLYSYIQNNPHRDEVYELFRQASIYMDNSILSKFKQSEGCRKSRQDELFEKFISIVRLYCSTEHGVRFYADKLFITPQYLSKVTKDVSGRSANAWIDEFVLLEAKTLLIHTSLSIQEISFNVGFSDQSSFGKFFKKNVGLSPTLYAKHMMTGKTPADT